MSRRMRLVERSGAVFDVRVESIALASGAEGAVHRIEGESRRLAKLYHDPLEYPDRRMKLEAMLAAAPDLPVMEFQGRRYVQIAWPQAWLEENGTCVGYVMPMVDFSRATALENLLARKTRARVGIPESYGYRLTAAANLSALVAELHAHGHHIIDLKPVNLNVYTDTFYIAMLDCDGFSIRGPEQRRFPAHQFSDGYICPEALQNSTPPDALGENQDRFALAVVLFQLLNGGLHPFQGVPKAYATIPSTLVERTEHELYAYGHIAHPLLTPSPWSIHEYFDDETRALFDRAFTTHDDRPSAREWQRHLQAYADVDSGKARVCQTNREHIHFTKGCPWCECRGNAPQPGQTTAARAGVQSTAGGATPGAVRPTNRMSARRRFARVPVGRIFGVMLAIAIPAWHIYSSENFDDFKATWFETYARVEIQQDWLLSATSSSNPYVELVVRNPAGARWRIESLLVEQDGRWIGAYDGDKSPFEIHAGGSRFRVPLVKPLREGENCAVKAALRYQLKNGVSRRILRVWRLQSSGAVELSHETVKTLP